MRIISGDLKRRRLLVPPGRSVRPTSDKVKEALFNILSARIEGAAFLDLYAGAGSIGIEAISRGAREVVFVEGDPKALHYLKKNLADLGIEGKARVVFKGVSDFLKKERGGPFDLIFLDPPYQSDEIEKTLPILAEGDMITDKGIVIIEHFHKKQAPEKIGRLNLLRRCKYGETALSFYVKE